MENILFNELAQVSYLVKYFHKSFVVEDNFHLGFFVFLSLGWVDKTGEGGTQVGSIGGVFSKIVFVDTLI